MKTVYKIKAEIVSTYGNYPKEQIAEIVKEAIEKIRLSEIKVNNIEVKVI